MVRREKKKNSSKHQDISEVTSTDDDEVVTSPQPKRRKKHTAQTRESRTLSSTPPRSVSLSPVNDDDTEKLTRQHLMDQRRSIGSPITVSTPASERRKSLHQTYGPVMRNGLNASVHESSNKHITDAKTLRDIYQTSIELFTAHKITQQNAFSIKLIECLQDIIKLDSFEKNNMHEFGRTLEIGGKIYVCRVDSTHKQVMDLACQIGAGKKPTKVPRLDGEENNEHNENFGEGEDVNNEEDNERQHKQRKKRAKNKHRHLKSEESLQMDFNYARRVQERKETLEALFDDWIENDEDFDYDMILYRHLEKPTEELAKSDEASAGKNEVNFSLVVVNPDVMSIIIFYPFYFQPLGVWCLPAFDVWGRLLDDQKPEDHNLDHRPGSKTHNYEHIASQNQRGSQMPPELLHEGYDGGDMEGDDGGFIGGGSILDECGQVKPVDINKLKSLDELGEYYLALKRLHLHKKDAYGWAGPNFIRNKRPVVLNNEAAKTKKSRPKEDPEYVDFLTVDWKNKNNRYQLVAPEKTQLDPAVIDEWIYSKTSIPYMGLVQPDFDDDEAEFDQTFEIVDEKDESYVDPLLRYFVDQNRNLLQLFSSGRHQADMSFADDHNWTNNDDVPELPDIEGGREFEDDFGDINKDNADTRSRSMHLYSDALKSFAHCFPNPIPGMPNPFEDPLSEAFNVDALRFAKQPKPINIHHLKKVILQILMRKLDLDIVTGKPQSENETTLDMVEFLQLLFDEVDARTRHFLSISIAIVALLHITVEYKLFMESDSVLGSNGKIICRGKNWRHKDHIPTSKNSAVTAASAISASSILVCDRRPSTVVEEMEESFHEFTDSEGNMDGIESATSVIMTEDQSIEVNGNVVTAAESNSNESSDQDIYFGTPSSG